MKMIVDHKDIFMHGYRSVKENIVRSSRPMRVTQIVQSHPSLVFLASILKLLR